MNKAIRRVVSRCKHCLSFCLGKEIRVLGFILIVTSLLTSCKRVTEHGGKTPIVQVGQQFLYQEDLKLPYGLSVADSARFVKDFMRKWIEEQLLYEKAELNVRGSERIAQMVEQYRRTLVLNNYERLLMEQEMSGELTEELLKKYYEENIQLFMLEEPVIKGVFIKAPLSSPGLADLKRWYKDKSETSLEQLEKYAFRNAVIYEYFYDFWVPVSELEGKLIINLAELGENFEEHRNIEVEDDNFCYLLHIEEYILKGEEKPYDLARQEIVDLLTNKRKVDFMNKVKEDLYNQSMDMGRIKYYNNETLQIEDDTICVVDDNAYSSAG